MLRNLTKYFTHRHQQPAPISIPILMLTLILFQYHPCGIQPMLHVHGKMMSVSCPYPYPYSCNIGNYLSTYLKMLASHIFIMDISCNIASNPPLTAQLHRPHISALPSCISPSSVIYVIVVSSPITCTVIYVAYPAPATAGVVQLVPQYKFLR